VARRGVAGPDRVGLLAPTIEGERLALDDATDGVTATVLRFGLFYGGAGNRGTDEKPPTRALAALSDRGDAGNYMSSIHCDDVATAVVAALTVPSGLYNVVDDEPLTRGDYLAAFGAAFGVKAPKPTPARLVRLLGGASADGLSRRSA